MPRHCVASPDPLEFVPASARPRTKLFSELFLNHVLSSHKIRSVPLSPLNFLSHRSCLLRIRSHAHVLLEVSMPWLFLPDHPTRRQPPTESTSCYCGSFTLPQAEAGKQSLTDRIPWRGGSEIKNKDLHRTQVPFPSPTPWDSQRPVAASMIQYPVLWILRPSPLTPAHTRTWAHVRTK